MLVADGVAGLIWPRRYTRLFEIGPEPLRVVIEAMAERPRLTRAACAAEIALGFWLAVR